MTANILFKRFNSFGDLADFAGQRPFATGCDYDSSQSPTDDDFNVISFDDALAIARAGGRWDSGAQLMKTAALAIDNARPQQKPRYKPAYAGARPSIPRLLAGASRHMVTRTKTPTAHRVIKLGVNVSKSWRVTQEESINRGAAILSLIHDLESTGDRVELYATLVVADSNQKNVLHYELLLKPAAAFFSAHDLAFALCHVDFLRRLIFAVSELHAAENAAARKVLADGYGGSYRNESQEIGAGYDVYFDRLTDGGLYTTPAQALNTINNMTALQITERAA